MVEGPGERQDAVEQHVAVVALRPTTPQNALGRRIDPTVWVPIAAGTWRAATAAADPDDEPPGAWSNAHGLRVAVDP